MIFINRTFEKFVDLNSTKIAVEEYDSSICYGELNIKSNILANILKHFGVKPNDIVAVRMPSSIGLVTSMLAVFKSRGIYLPINDKFSRSKLLDIFERNFDGFLIIQEDSFDETLDLILEYNLIFKYLFILDEHWNVKVFVQEEWGLDEQEYEIDASWKANLNELYSPDDTPYIFYTSGSTGSGNAVLGIHSSLSHFISWEINEFAIDDSYRISQIASVTFDASLKDILVALCSGATVVIPPNKVRENPINLVSWLEEKQISLIQCVPSILRLLLNGIEESGNTINRLNKVKIIALAGEMLYNRDVKRIRSLISNDIEVINLYGATELTILKSFNRIGDLSIDDFAPVSVGKPITETFIAIIEDCKLCKIGEIGEVYIKSPHLTKGYINNVQLTNEKFVQNPLTKDNYDIVYKTGDLGRYLPDRSVEILGRIDNQVKLNGVRVELNQVEGAIANIPDISDAVIILQATEFGGEFICFYTGKEFSTNELRTLLKQDLNDEVMPAHFIHLEELPYNLNGKVDRKQLEKNIPVLTKHKFAIEETIGATENMLENIWKDILRQPQIGRNISFFEIGGSSITAIQMISRIFKSFQILLDLNVVFENSTIEKLSVIIDGSQSTSYLPISVVDRKEYHNLSLTQHRIWYLNQYEDENSHYNLQAAFYIKGLLTFDLCSKAYKMLIERHESLRTVFVIKDGEPKQHVLNIDNIIIDAEFSQLSGKGLTANSDPIKDILKKDDFIHFNLGSGPLSKFRLIQLSANEFIIAITVHHIAADGWSMGIAIHDFSILYESLAKNTIPVLPKIDVQYIDFSEWQISSLSSEKTEQQVKYWNNQLDGAPQLLNLLTDNFRPDIQTFNGAEYKFEIPGSTYSNVLQLGRHNDVSTFMVLISVFYVLLHKETGDNDIIIGIPASNRNRKELEPLMGFFLNTLPLRAKNFTNISFKDFLVGMKKNILDAYTNQDLPFESIVKELDIERNPAYTPLFQVLFVMLNMPQLDNIKSFIFDDILPINSESDTSRFDFTIFLEEKNNVIEAKFEYNRDLFEAETMQILSLKYLSLLDQFSNNENMYINDASIALGFDTDLDENHMLISENF